MRISRAGKALAFMCGVAAAVTACGSQGALSGKPVVLHLTSSGSAVRAAGIAEPASSGDSSLAGGYELVGTLPSSQPDPQPIYRLQRASKTDAGNVAGALGLSQNLTAVKGGWVVRGPNGTRLAVRDDGSWTYGMDCYADQPIESESLDVMCASATGGGVAVASDSTAGPADTMTAAPPPNTSPAPNTKPAPNTSPAPNTTPSPPDSPPPTTGPDPVVTTFPTPPPGPPPAEAEQVARRIFEQLGIGTQNLYTYQGSPTTSVVANPEVDGKRTSGWSTRLDIDADDHVAGADGWLTTTTKGADYPVISAGTAFEELGRIPLGRPDICMVRKDGKPGCEEPQPLKVTDAVLGLTLAHDEDGALLVPAWLFTVEGQSEPATQIAIDPSYLAPPGTPEPGEPVNVGSPEQVPPATPK